MKFEFFRRSVAFSYFSTAFLRQRFPDIGEEYLAVQLSRWCRAGRLVKIRKGFYAFAESEMGLDFLIA